MFMIYFLRHFMKYKNSENRFSEFSLSWKTLLLNLFPCLINSFFINDVYKSLKRKCKHYVKANKVVFVFYITKFEVYWRYIGVIFANLWMKSILTILMLIKHRGGIKNCSCFFSLFLKITEIWQKPLEAVL